ncbi:MAG TPA: DUF58 domain-containing protein, partial [Acidimicrobiia bacterium]|nr:DUF58 domain-containing protein [Acidimicrobiia bacterium]
RRTLQVDPPEQVTVYPKVDVVSALPLTAGRDLVGGAVTDFSRARSGSEFHSLREYQVGDDLRRVHWRSTARTGQLMIREHDVPWQTRATLLLDDRGAGYTTASFERAVEGIASVATALHQRRAMVRLLTTSGLDTGFGMGYEHHEAIMERLAVARPSSGDRFDAVAGRLHRQATTGALIAFAGALGTDDLTKLGTLGRRFGFVGALRFGVVPSDGPATLLPGVTVVDLPMTTPFAAAWHEAMILRFGIRPR